MASCAGAYLVSLALLTATAVLLGQGYGLVFVGLPVAVVASLVGFARAVVIRWPAGGTALFLAVLLGVAAFFTAADLRYASEARVRVDLLRDVGSAIDNHVLPRGGLVMGAAHVLAAVWVLASAYRASRGALKR